MTITRDTIDILVSKGWQEIETDLNCWTLALDGRRHIEIYPRYQFLCVDYRFDGIIIPRFFEIQEPELLAEQIESDGRLMFGLLGFDSTIAPPIQPRVNQ